MIIYFLLTAVIACACGAVLAWLFLRNKITSAYERGRLDSASENAVLQERVNGKDSQIEDLKNSLLNSREEIKAV